MFKICRFQLKNTFCSPRVYLAFFLGITIQIISLMPFFEFAKAIGNPLCIFESVVYSNCDVFAPVASFLAFLLLVSDIPFSTQNEAYTLLRVSKTRWAAGKSIYLFLICSIYYLITNLAGAAFISECAYIGNFWSMPLYSLTKDTNSVLTASYNVYFPYGYILHNLSPISAAALIYILSVTYGTLMSLLVFCLNMKFSRVLSYAGTMIVHIVSYTLTAVSVSAERINLSLFSNSLLMYHNVGKGSNEVYNTIPKSFLIFAGIICLLFVIIVRSIRKYDFQITAGGKK